MMKLINLTTRIFGAFLLISGLTLASCSKSEDDNNNNGNPSGSAQVSVRLTDGPADYDAIWLDIQEVVILSDGGNSTTLKPSRPGQYDLLTLSNGVDTLLTTGPIPAGTVSQIRLILGPNNSIVVDGKAYALNTPSAQESGLKLNLHETLSPGGSYTFWLDFDAAKSIHQTGSGKYMLKPVIRAYTELTNGKIAGVVLPPSSLTTVYAIQGTDTFSAIPESNGYFQISGLPSGTYQVYYDANAAGFADFSLNGVSVNYGVTTDLGTRIMIP